MVNIELYELKNLLMEAAAMGAAMVQKPNDVMRQREAEAYMVAQGYAKNKLGELVAHGLVRFHRLSDAKNSPSVCSRVELMAAVSALKKKTINFNKIN